MVWDKIADEREAAWDRYYESFPKCECCGHAILPGTVYLPIKNGDLICETCIDDNLETMEEDFYD